MERRQQILQAAEVILLDQGVRKTTIAQIARLASIGVGSVYLEFESKDDIILELSTTRHNAILRAMRRATMSEGDWASRLKGMLLARQEAFTQTCQVGAKAQELMHCSECEAIKAAHETFMRAQRELLVDFLQMAVDAKEFQIKDIPQCAESILLATQAFCPPQVYALPPQTAKQKLEQVVGLLINGLKP